MADSNIGSLPQAETLDDDSLLVAEQQGAAVKVTGAQFKEFGRQAVIGQVQGYVDQAQAAAAQAASAASAVTDMTVEASTLASGQNATVTKTTKNGKVNLAFGLPRGEQGLPGEEGKEGPRGPQGPPGKGLTILGYYNTLDDLKAAVPAPETGDAYGIGLIAPYSIYVFDGVSGKWVDNGQLSGGGGGGPLPENVVTAEGGASMSFPVDLGDGPHVITFVDEEEPPLTAEDVQYSGTENVKQAIDGLKTSVSDGKALVASAITDKGVPTAQDATFAQMAENIGEISTGADTSDATATSFDILAPKTAYTAAGKVEGTIPTLLGQTITPGTSDKALSGGQYLGGDQIIKGDANLTSSNIKSGVTLFGVEGSLESTFQAVLTVTADTGAVVTATHTDGTEVSALSQNGTVVLDLPKEGTWKVTAVRGIAQYNTVTIQVTSHYTAELTATLHIEYFGTITELGGAKYALEGVSIGDYALFGGGRWNSGYNSEGVDAYSKSLTHSNPTSLSIARQNLAAASVGDYALFGGGIYITSGTEYNTVDAYNKSLVHTTPTPLSVAQTGAAGASIGNYALFGGGTTTVDAYNASLTRTTPDILASAISSASAGSNDNYAIFADSGSSSGIPTAYDKNLTRTFPTALTKSRGTLYAARAGNYVLFASGSSGYKTVEAYDLFLTKTTAESISIGRMAMGSTTLNGFALFAGGEKGGLASQVGNVDSYDPLLVHTTPENLKEPRSSLGAATVGEYALFCGGSDIYRATNKSEAYRYV